MHGRSITRRLLAGLTALALLGCGGEQPAEEAAERTHAAPDTLDEAAIDQLRSLPYVSGSPAPEDAPDGVVLHVPDRACPGLRLYTTPDLGRADLIDAGGTVQRTWQRTGETYWARTRLMPGGDLLVVGRDQPAGTIEGVPDSAHFLMRLDPDGRQRWKRRLQAHHDVALTPDGRLATLVFARRRVPSIDPHVVTRDEYVTTLNAQGEVIAELSILEAINRAPEAFPLQQVKPSDLRGELWIDLFHANSIEWMSREALFGSDPLYGPDHLLLCFRHQDRVAIFDWRRGRAIWSWGRTEISGPHDASLLADGNILLFDNGLGRGWSRAIELDPRRRAIVWEYRADPPEAFYTASKGSAQRLPNGNTLLAESDVGRAIEVTPAGEIVWEFLCPHRLEDGRRAAIARMTLYPGTGAAREAP
jgi:hypothetical protein